MIPTRNRWPLLQDALASALGQRDVAVEVVVIDDASDDETPTRLAAINDRRLRVVRVEDRGGVSRARNTGVEVARGEWVAFLDDDDLWAPTKLRAQLDAATGEGAVFAYGGAVVVDGEQTILQVKAPPGPESVARDLLIRNVIPGGCSNVVARTEVVREVGGFDPDLSMLADWDLWVRLAHAGAGAACEEIVVAYRRHAGSMIARCAGNVLSEVSYLRGKHRALADELDAELDVRAQFRYFARAHRRGDRRLQAAALYLLAAVHGHSLGDAARAVGALAGLRRASSSSDSPVTALATPLRADVGSWLVPRTTG